jgi:DNA replication protein DnaC
MVNSNFSNVSSLVSKNQKSETRNCEQHGSYSATCITVAGQDHWSACPACDKEAQAQESKALAAELSQQLVSGMLGRAAVPERFSEKTLQNYNVDNEGQRKALESCRRYVENWSQNRAAGTSLIMCGHPGTGKTHLAIGIARELMAAGHSALFARVIELARSVKETYQDKSKTERQVLAEFTRPDLLILDEVGVQHGSDTERMILFEVINARYEQCKPTILITNLSLVGLREYLDARAEDRLREGGGRVIVFDWESQRGKL